MSKKHSLESFVSDIDKIVAGDLSILSECDDSDEEYKELLLTARLLAKADYTPEKKNELEKIISKVRKSNDDELEDDELDMVAGGVNTNGMSGEKEGKDGI